MGSSCLFFWSRQEHGRQQLSDHRALHRAEQKSKGLELSGSRVVSGLSVSVLQMVIFIILAQYSGI